MEMKQPPKNPPVDPGTRRDDIVIGICHDCSKRKVLAKTSRICVKCWGIRLDNDAELVTAMEAAVASSTDRVLATSGGEA